MELTSTIDNPAPAGGITGNREVRATGFPLRFARWSSEGQAKGTVLSTSRSSRIH